MSELINATLPQLSRQTSRRLLFSFAPNQTALEEVQRIAD